jgi:hypothetical protein
LVRIVGELLGLPKVYTYIGQLLILILILLSFLGSTAQLRPWPPPQNPAEFLGGFSTILFFTG